MPLPTAKATNPQTKEEVVSGFPGGLNTYQDETLIKNTELTQMVNAYLTVDGIEPRPGTLDYTSASGSKVLGEIGYYNSNGTRQLLRVDTTGRLKKLSGTSWVTIGSKVFDTSSHVNMVQARDKIYIFNGIDNLTYYDGSTITSFSPLTTPTGLAITTAGTAGTTTYSYSISAYNDVGETIAGSSVQITTGNATLDATNHNKLTWTAVTGAVGYNIWGRLPNGLGETYLDESYTNSYDDMGQRSQSTTLLPPEGDTTAGVIGSMGEFAINRLFVAGDPDNPSRLSWGGVGTNLNNFSGASDGGGWIDVFRNDGYSITAIKPFQGGVIVWKENAIYKFKFTQVTIGSSIVEVPQLEEITRSFGGASYRATVAVENDIIFPSQKDGRLAFYSLGNQENYAGTVLRTNELSVKIAPSLRDVNLSMIEKSAGFYFEGLYGVAMASTNSSVNDTIWLLDSRFGSWSKWEGFTPNHFVRWIDSNKEERLLYGHESNGKTVEMFRTEKSDNGEPFQVEVITKSFNQKMPFTDKRYYDPSFQFKNINKPGVLFIDIYTNGGTLSGTFSITSTTTGGGGFGLIQAGGALFGDAGAVSIEEGIRPDTIHEEYASFESVSVKYRIYANTADLDFKLLSLRHKYVTLREKRISSFNRSYL